jgi:hypothetical protein
MITIVILGSIIINSCPLTRLMCKIHTEQAFTGSLKVTPLVCVALLEVG